MKKISVAIMLLVLGTITYAQDKYFTKTAKIEFFSKAALEDIDAKNKTATAILDAKTGAVQFAVVMKGFEFQKALMQEHFNENYVESGKYPKAEFKGTVTNNSSINYSKDGTYTAKVKGKMTIHGVTKDVETTGTVKVDEGKLQLNSAFNLLLSDYNIRIPAVVKDKLSNSIRVSVDARLEPLK
jgi:hypothetical protein